MTTRLIVTWVRRHHGDAGVHRLLELAGDDRPVAALEDELGWSTYDQKVALFEAAVELSGDPGAARRIGESLFEERLAAPLKLVIGALGSPQQVLRSCARANARFSTTSSMEALESERGRAVVTYRVDEGYVPNRHDCLYTQGILTQASALFGLPPARVVQQTCQVTGDACCRYEVTWHPRRRWLRRSSPRSGLSEVEILQERVADLEDTVSDLVSSRDLDEVLGRIATRAGAAVRGQRFLLVVELAGESGPRVHSDGFDEHTAAELGAGLLADTSGSGAGNDRLVAEVASSRRHHGFLAAYLPEGTGFLPQEQAQLDAYGRLAAAAIDSATALADARRGEATAQAVLALAHQLAQEEDEGAVAELVAAAIPAVVGCDRAAVLLRDDDGRFRAAALHGSEGSTGAEVAQIFEAGLDRAPVLSGMLASPEPRMLTRSHPDRWARQVVMDVDATALAVAPIIVRDTFVGAVVGHWASASQPPEHHATILRGLAGLADHAGVAIGGIRLLEHARHQATHDPLTGLANRALLDERLHGLALDRRQDGSDLAVCFIDLDGFKRVNDSLGHAAGDEVLVEVAARIRRRIRNTDVVARVSGDEFVVVLPDLADVRDAVQVARTLVEVLREPFSVRAGRASIGASIGIAYASAHGQTPEELLRAADGAMYEVKVDGGGHRVAARPDRRLPPGPRGQPAA